MEKSILVEREEYKMRVKRKRNLMVFAIALLLLMGAFLSAARVFGALDVSGAESVAKGGSGEAKWKASPNNGRHSSWETPGSGFTVPPEYANKLKKTGTFATAAFGKSCTVESLSKLYANQGGLKGRSGNTHFCFDVKENSKGKFGIWLRNLAVYDNKAGKDIKLDCKLTIMDWTDETDSTPAKHHVVLTRNRALPGVDISGLKEVRLKWDYYKAGTDTGYRLKSNVTFNDIDSTQYMGFKVDQVLYQFAHANTALKFKTQNGYSIYTDPNYGNDDFMNPKQAFGVAYESNSVIYTYGTKTNGTFSTFGELSYSMFQPVPNNPTKSVSDSDEKGKKQVLLSGENETITYNVQQVVANGYAPDTYMKSFVMEDTLESCLEILSAKVQQNGKDTDIFTVTTQGQSVRAEAKASALKEAGFYNKRYNLVIQAKLREGVTPEQLKPYVKGDIVSIPNTGKVTIDNKPRVTNEVEVRLWEANPEKTVSDSDETKVQSNRIPSRLETFIYDVTQSIPGEVEALSSLEFSDDVEECLQVKGVRVLENGADVSSKWNIRTSENQVKAVAGISGKAAAGKTYTLEITAQIKPVSHEILQAHGHYNSDRKSLIFKNKGKLAWRTGNGEERNAQTNEVTTSLPLDTDIGIQKKVDRYEHQVGDPVHYTVTVTHGAADCEATDLAVHDTDLEHFDVDVSSAKVNGVTEYTLKPVAGGWELRTQRLEKGQKLSIDFIARAKKEVNGTIVSNTASVKCFGVPEKSAEEEIYVNSPKLKLTKESDRGNYRVGDTIDYTLELSQINRGCFMRDVVLADTIETEGVRLLPGTIIVLDKKGKNVTASMDVTIKDGAFTVETGRNFSDNSETVPPKEKGKEPYANLELTGYLKVCYSARIASDRLSNSEVVNKAELPSRPNTNGEVVKEDPDIPSGGAQEEHRTPVAGAELRIEKSSDKKQYQAGETGLYTIKVEQIREDYTADKVMVRDKFQQEGVAIEPDSLKVAYNRTNITKDCEISVTDNGYEIKTNRDLPYGDTITITYKVRFSGEKLQDRELINAAVAAAENAKEKETEHAVEIGEVPVSIELEKTSDKKEYRPGEPIHYSLKVTSTGSGTAEQVVIRDEIKTKGATLDEKSIRVMDKEEKDITEDCKIKADDHSFVIHTGKNLEPKACFKVVYTAFADESLCGKEVENIATAGADNAKEKEEEHTVTVTDISGSLEIVKETDKMHYQPEEMIRYTLVVTSKGPGTAENVVIKDEIKTKGAVLDSECIMVEDDKGRNITENCRIEAGENGFIIKTGRDLKPGEYLRVFYKAEAEKSLAGKEVENLAVASSENSEPSEDDHTVTIEPPENIQESTEADSGAPSSPDQIQEGLTLSPQEPEDDIQEGLSLPKERPVPPKTPVKSVQTGDESSMLFFFIMATAAALVLLTCVLGRKRRKRRQ